MAFRVFMLTVAFLAQNACVSVHSAASPIPVGPGASARASIALGRVSKPSHASATVRMMEGASRGLLGLHASGQAGDYVLENGAVVFVVRGLRAEGAGAAAGRLIDAADAQVRLDEFEELSPIASGNVRYTHLAFEQSEEGDAVVIATGTLERMNARVVTEYVLPPAGRQLLIQTQITNVGTEPLPLELMNAEGQWNGKRVTGAFFGEGVVGDNVSYRLLVQPEHAHENSLAPGESVSLTSELFVGVRADEASLRMATHQGPTGRLRIVLIDAAGKSIAMSRARLHPALGASFSFAADASGRLEGDVPAGLYTVAVELREGNTARAQVLVRDGNFAIAKVRALAPTSL
jgi:hypothetical protein